LKRELAAMSHGGANLIREGERIIRHARDGFAQPSPAQTSV